MFQTQNNQFRVLVSGLLVATVTRREITMVDEDRNVNVFGGQGWNILVHVENLVAGTRLVFTNLLNNNLMMMPFQPSGWEWRHDVVERMVLNSQKRFIMPPAETGLLMKLFE